MSTECKMNLQNIFAPNLKIIITKKKKNERFTQPIRCNGKFIIIIVMFVCVYVMISRFLAFFGLWKAAPGGNVSRSDIN